MCGHIFFQRKGYSNKVQGEARLWTVASSLFLCLFPSVSLSIHPSIHPSMHLLANPYLLGHPNNDKPTCVTGPAAGQYKHGAYVGMSAEAGMRLLEFLRSVCQSKGTWVAGHVAQRASLFTGVLLNWVQRQTHSYPRSRSVTRMHPFMPVSV